MPVEEQAVRLRQTRAGKFARDPNSRARTSPLATSRQSWKSAAVAHADDINWIRVRASRRIVRGTPVSELFSRNVAERCSRLQRKNSRSAKMPPAELKQRASSPRVSAKDETGRPRACEEKRKTCELQSARANVQWSVADHAHVKSNLSLS